ncbi:MAG TPA: glycosyltransferase family 4 protein [Gemmatimonadales bacterium]|nr:glycosyltransferase family 4 protein [Gemmatimonadales bacterium]
MTTPTGYRVLVVQPTGDKMGHYGLVATKLCQALTRRGHAVTLCTNLIRPESYLDEPPAFSTELVGSGRLAFAPFDRAKRRCPPYYYWGYYRNSVVVTSAALKLCRRRTFDVVYMTDVEFFVAALLLRVHHSFLPPVVMQVNAANFTFRDYPGSIVTKSYKVIQREVFRTALGTQIAACAVLGEWHRERLRTQLRIPVGLPVAVIPDGGDAPAAPLSQAEARRTLGIDYAGPVFLFFGMLRRDKGIEYLVRAAARLRDEEFRLLIAGYPMEYAGSQIVEMVRDAGVSDRVILRLRYADDRQVPAYFFAADALVLPYTREYRGGSGPLMKGACAHRRPVIASNVSAMGELVERHAIGFVCVPEDPSSLADAMRTFLALPREHRVKMGERASTLTRANSWDVMADRFTELFERTIRPSAR